MNTIAITGGFGFLGWHTACRLRALYAIDPVLLSRSRLADMAALDDALGEVDAAFHLAGVNRAKSDAQVEQGNVELAEILAGAVIKQARPLHVVYANSIQAALDNPYGRGKRRAAEVLAEAVAGVGGRFTDIRLPNLFGEHGRPSYNSFVATFANEVAHGRLPRVTGDGQVSLLHAQEAVQYLVQAVVAGAIGQLVPEGMPMRVTTVLTMLERLHELYSLGEVPPLTTSFEVNLCNTYRAFRFPNMFPIAPKVHADWRGDLIETVRSHSGPGQSFVPTTPPGQMRGDHYPLHKVERFFVLKGRGRGLAPPAAAGRRGLLPAEWHSTGHCRHADAVGAQHPQRRRQRADHRVLGGPVARSRALRPVPRNGSRKPRSAITRAMTIAGGRPEIIQLDRVMIRLGVTLDRLLVHTGLNCDHHLNQRFPQRPWDACAGPLSQGGHGLAWHGAGDALNSEQVLLRGGRTP